jgi:hypothetical protein
MSVLPYFTFNAVLWPSLSGVSEGFGEQNYDCLYGTKTDPAELNFFLLAAFARFCSKYSLNSLSSLLSSQFPRPFLMRLIPPFTFLIGGLRWLKPLSGAFWPRALLSFIKVIYEADPLLLWFWQALSSTKLRKLALRSSAECSFKLDFEVLSRNTSFATKVSVSLSMKKSVQRTSVNSFK